jgi:hypothetical protein
VSITRNPSRSRDDEIASDARRDEKRAAMTLVFLYRRAGSSG